jgi:DNA-binding NtrC family response regulator
MQKNVLVVDDDSQIRRLCRLTLEESGYFVAGASNGKEALAAIRQSSFDVILLDLCMPDMDGIEFLLSVRADLPKHRIVVMSGFMKRSMLPAAIKLGGTATLDKPFSPESLLSAIDQVLGQDSLHRHSIGGESYEASSTDGAIGSLAESASSRTFADTSSGPNGLYRNATPGSRTTKVGGQMRRVAKNKQLL